MSARGSQHNILIPGHSKPFAAKAKPQRFFGMTERNLAPQLSFYAKMPSHKFIMTPTRRFVPWRLVALCAGLGFLLSKLAHLDRLTAYFATCPGGADSIAILTAGSTVDVPLVMSIQRGRVIAVMLFGPALAKYAARLAVTPPAAAILDAKASAQ